MISIGYAGGFSTKERAKLDLVIGQANRVQQSQEFQREILAHKVKTAKLIYSGFVDTTDTPLQVYSRLMATNAPVEIYLQTPPWYKRWFTSELARENTDGTITLNRDYFNRATIAPLVGTIIHELCHRGGYTHSYNRTADRDLSVPYAAGIVAEKLANGLTLTPMGEMLQKASAITV